MNSFMIKAARRILAGLSLACITALAAGAAIHMPAPERLDWEDFRGGAWVSGDLYLSGQPLTAGAMQELEKAGIEMIVNLRTPAEMSDPQSTPIDEAALAGELNITYVSLPSGGEDYPYSGETVSALAEILAARPGKVLLHCSSGRRATHLWVAYLIEHGNIAPDAAIALGRQANFGTSPLQHYLEGRLRHDLSHDGPTD